jgi:hypothetical protein
MQPVASLPMEQSVGMPPSTAPYPAAGEAVVQRIAQVPASREAQAGDTEEVAVAVEQDLRGLVARAAMAQRES